MRNMISWMVAATVTALVLAPITMRRDDTHAIPCGDGYVFSADILNPIEDVECHIDDGWLKLCLKSDDTTCIMEKL